MKFITNVSDDLIATYWANAPSISEPRVIMLGLAGFLGSVYIGRAITLSPILELFILEPTDTIVPQTSMSCISGNLRGVPDQLLPSLFVDLEYQPVLVFRSVLLTPAANTFIKTSSSFGTGTDISVLYSNFSNPPWPVNKTACIVFGTFFINNN